MGLAGAHTSPQAAISGTNDPRLRPEFGGVDLSRGQWQRLAIARALARPGADLTVFDEPTAALDPPAEMELFEQSSRLAAGRTVGLVSRRLGPTRHRVLVLEGGRLVEDGPPSRLLAGDGPFARMFAAQAGWYRCTCGGRSAFAPAGRRRTVRPHGGVGSVNTRLWRPAREAFTPDWPLPGLDWALIVVNIARCCSEETGRHTRPRKGAATSPRHG